MEALRFFLLIHASLQLHCDHRQIKASVGGELIIFCKYDTYHFLFSKKYWCRGESMKFCEVLADSERSTKSNAAHRSHVIDAGRRGLIVKITDLQFDDSGEYWIGIDKVYHDIMTSVSVLITDVPVSKPRIWPLSSLVDRPTCWGQNVTVRCSCSKGTSIHYAWYQQTHKQDILLHQSSDFFLHCSMVEKDGRYYCTARNGLSSQESDFLSVHLQMSADNSCVYNIKIQDQPIYDCRDRMSTSTTETPALTSHQSAKKIQHSDKGNQSLHSNQTNQDPRDSRVRTGMPVWYMILRWVLFASLLKILCSVCKYTKTRHDAKFAKRRTAVYFRQTSHSAR